MGELRGDELARWMTWWRMYYEEGKLDRVPRELVERWDAEGTKGAA
jgi:hypothetical protein